MFSIHGGMSTTRHRAIDDVIVIERSDMRELDRQRRLASSLPIHSSARRVCCVLRRYKQKAGTQEFAGLNQRSFVKALGAGSAKERCDPRFHLRKLALDHTLELIAIARHEHPRGRPIAQPPGPEDSTTIAAARI
jgi:hypothetical protein